jgi:hypothetical protein
MRAPFYICLEVYRPEDEKEQNPFSKVKFDCNTNDLRLSDAKTLTKELIRLSEKPGSIVKNN